MRTAWINDLPSGPIDQEELDKVLLGWGTSVVGLGAANVPEPSGIVLVLLALTVVMMTSGWTTDH